MIVQNFGRASGLLARIENGLDVFVCYSGQWEWYRKVARGPRRGLEMFQGYVSEERQLAVLNHALHPLYKGEKTIFKDGRVVCSTELRV